jgi:iron(III) transport system ATP-binding protein
MADVSLLGLRKQFQESVAVDDITLNIADGELVALLGPSGCGKTTTLRMVAGFEMPTSGEIKVGGRLVSSATFTVPPEERRMSMIFQTYAVWPHLTVFENVAFGLRLRKISRDEVARRVRETLAVVRLDEFGDRYPPQLSGGQQQRVSLARALTVEPEILLLDEPLSNLDANLREEMRFEIRRLHDKFGITSIYVTHDQAEAMVAADRIVVMNKGRIEQVGTAEDVYDRPLTRFVASFIGTSNILDCPWSDGAAVLSDCALVVSQGIVPPSGAAWAAVSIRPHDVRLHAQDARPAGVANVFQAEVARATFLGDYRDYLLKLPNTATMLRVFARPSQRFEAGQLVWVHLPADTCRYLQP